MQLSTIYAQDKLTKQSIFINFVKVIHIIHILTNHKCFINTAHKSELCE